MKKIFINSNNYVKSPYIQDANIEIEISDEQYDKICNTPFNYAWHYINNDFALEPLLDDETLRERRSHECFPIINRGELWYKLLTDEQKEELDAWYQAWLNVTETKVIPDKPKWLT